MADLMSAWETGITCQAKYNLEHNFTHLVDVDVVEDFLCDLIWKRIICKFLRKVVPLYAHTCHESFRSVFIVIRSKCNRQKLCTTERDVGSLLQGTPL